MGQAGNGIRGGYRIWICFLAFLSQHFANVINLSSAVEFGIVSGAVLGEDQQAILPSMTGFGPDSRDFRSPLNSSAAL